MLSADPQPLEASASARSRAPGPARAGAWVRLLRPRQWVKNLLVLAAPLAAGRLAEPVVAAGTVVAVVAFCLAASACYLVNDVMDVQADRLHPVKRTRPVAAREVRASEALVVAGLLALTATALAAWWSLPLALTLLAYLAVQLGYMSGLKHQPALDLAVVASGFLLRAVAGGTATGTALSPWFLLVATFGALFMVAGKRYSEIRRQGQSAGTRRSLEHYSESYLRFIWTLAAGVTVTVYLMWALTGANVPDGGTPWAAFSVAPFVLGLLRYAATVDTASAEAPEDVLLGDHHLQVVGLAWLALIVLHATTR